MSPRFTSCGCTRAARGSGYGPPPPPSSPAGSACSRTAVPLLRLVVSAAGRLCCLHTRVSGVGRERQLELQFRLLLVPARSVRGGARSEKISDPCSVNSLMASR
eukprot:768012-Hanusia_phi.AAC.2